MNDKSPPVGQPTPSIDLGAVQSLRKIALFALGGLAVLILLTGHSLWPDSEDSPHEIIETVGVALLALAIAGRTWCSLYISGRKKSEIVALGPYSISRNPLYVFSFIGAAGAGAQFGSFTAAVAAALLTWVVFSIVVRKEERFLAERFGETYLAYKARVPRFWPNFRLWQNVDTLEIRPRMVMQTFIDACVFLAAIPLAEGIEMAQAAGWLPVLWLVP
ncbi:isoprenylcysteine carboxylmethyltransferase family protein [Ancylobacter sp. Lp-2]|uniref:methyltransferase family protein n=1 Tax=Ancylobacter sp. Lp-2 TaxID=2881339 RepID=UPI001E339278|nr:isoprenylcysteine carboxylmethyltransferase family protein [Ancylobacter sp. Lp-2]MCB4770551.1 isoprenylcysteine carboxylmethyltransferase family protein [Ancylobacter sp. Lp-2]